jgi:uncharacterized protein with ATP-grasp and redox domains
LRQAHEAIGLAAISGEAGAELFSAAQQLVGTADRSVPPPMLAQRMQRLILQRTGNKDLCASVKQRLNEKAAELYPEWHRRFAQAYRPLEAAVRLAVVGNLLDVGAKARLSDDVVVAALEDALKQPLVGSMREFADAIWRARDILFLADNAGEIVFDRDLLVQLPPGRVTLAVRGAAVLNDATMADAQRAGLEKICSVITNGSDAPGTILDDCSADFRARFGAADLVVSKGQGNYESLVGADKQIFFLLMVKCPVIARALGCPTGSLVLHRNPAGDGARMGGTTTWSTP